MNNRDTILVIVIALIAGVAAGVWWSHRTESPKNIAAEGERKVLYWHDPMKPEQKFDKPGKSPYMDMQLVPVYADDASAATGVKINSNVTQSLGIRLGKVAREAIEPHLSAVGTVAFDEHRTQIVQARVTGYVTRLFVKAQLDRVRKGQVLAEITSPEWQEAQQEYAALLKSASPQSHELRVAARQRLIVLAIPQASIARIEAGGEIAPTTEIYAPQDGVVTELGVREGAAFMAGAMLFRINGLDAVWVNAQIPEAQIHLVPMGAAVVARATSWPGQSFNGRVQTLLPEVDSATRTITVRAELDNKGGKLSPGMFVALDISQPRGAPQLVVPSEAVIVTGRRTVVITSSDSGAFAVADVVTGGQVGDKTIILKGLEENQSIVLSGQFLIDSEASLTSTVDRLTGAVDEHAAHSPEPKP